MRRFLTSIPVKTFSLAGVLSGLSPFLAVGEEGEIHPVMEFFGMGKSPFTTINPANSMGREINELYGLTGWIGLLIFLILMVLFVVIVLRFRAKANPEPTDMHGNFFLETLWTVIPVIILIVIAVPTIQLIFKIDGHPDLVENSKITMEFSDGNKEYGKYLEINAIGHQWWWEFEYVGMHHRKTGATAPSFTPIYKVTANEPWFPIDVPIKLNLTSEDVIHSFWLPRISGKTDAVPGKINNLSFVVEEEGFYYGLCAEYCGASHALMRFHVQGVSEAKFNEWLEWGRGEPVAVNASAERGKEALGTCLACHTFNGMRNFEPRKERLEASLRKYDSDRTAYLEDVENWKADMAEAGKLDGKWDRELDAMASKPVAPVIPKLFRKEFRTIAPDLTDLRLRKKILAGVRDNTRANLVEWIKNPRSIKPDIQGTPVIRMPAYEHVFEEKTIDDIVEFLLTVEYPSSSGELTLSRK